MRNGLVVDKKSTKYWYVNDKLHRENGPAIEEANDTKRWYINDKLHREDGPAIEYANGTKQWWVNDRRLTEEEFALKLFIDFVEQRGKYA